jgi:ketosteroid isomerase-like protein
VYPEITWGLTLRVAGDAIDYSALPSLARLPWFRHAFMPDWLRRMLVARLPPAAGERLRMDLAGLLDDLARTSGDGSSGGSGGSALRIARWMGSIGTIDMLRAAPAGSPLRDHVFLGFMARASVDPLGLSVPQPLGRLFRGRVGRFTAPLDRTGAAVGFGRQLFARFRSWVVFHSRQARLAQSCALGLLLLLVWRPAQEQISEGVIAAEPVAASEPAPEPTVVPETPPPAPPAAAPRPAVNPAQPRLPVTVAPQANPRGNANTAPIPPLPQSPPQGPRQNAGGAVPGPVAAGVVDGPGLGDVAAGEGDRAGAGAAEQAQANSRPAAAAAAPAASDNAAAIQQLLAGYASAMESLDPAAVAAVYPSVNTQALGAAFRQYNSLDEEITISRIDVASDGQSATVNAVLSINQVVKIGRAAPVTRNVVFALRRQGDRWVIESIK